MATKIISEGEFEFSGLSAQSGMVLQNINFTYTPQIVKGQDEDGCTSGVNYYDQTISITLDALVPDTGAFSSTICTTITLANIPPAFLHGGNGTGKAIIEEITYVRSNTGISTYSLKITYYPFI